VLVEKFGLGTTGSNWTLISKRRSYFFLLITTFSYFSYLCFLLITFISYLLLMSATYPFRLLLIAFSFYLLLTSSTYSFFKTYHSLFLFLELIVAYCFYPNKRVLNVPSRKDRSLQPTRTSGRDAVGVVGTTRGLFVVTFVQRCAV
jgi:hypothetical protein